MSRSNRGKTVRRLLENVEKNGISSYTTRKLAVKAPLLISAALLRGYNVLDIDSGHLVITSGTEIKCFAAGAEAKPTVFVRLGLASTSVEPK